MDSVIVQALAISGALIVAAAAARTQAEISAAAITSAAAVWAAVLQWVITVASEAGREASAAGLPARAVVVALPAWAEPGVAEVLVVVVAPVVVGGGKS